MEYAKLKAELDECVQDAIDKNQKLGHTLYLITKLVFVLSDRIETLDKRTTELTSIIGRMVNIERLEDQKPHRYGPIK